MSELTRLVDKRSILMGRPLPYSIYDGDRKLLLAQGHLVESERVRERLLKHGMYFNKDRVNDSPVAPGAEEEPDSALPPDPLQLLVRDYSSSVLPKRYSVTLSPQKSGEGHACWVVGVSTPNRSLVLTAPVRPDKSLVAVAKGQIWFCKLFNATTVYRFRAPVLKVAFEPFHYLHIEVPQNVERRVIRQTPRALVNLEAAVTTPDPFHAVVVDLSVSGARIAVQSNVVMQPGQSLDLRIAVEVLGKAHPIELSAKVMAGYGKADARHPQVVFYGLQFQPLREQYALLLHGYVQQQLARQYDGLSQALTADAPAGPVSSAI